MMEDSKYNGMFKVSSEKRNFFNAKTGETTSHNIIEKCKHDIRNENTYNMKGILIKEAGQISHNTDFLLTILDLRINDTKEFFNYQYSFTPNKDAFLNYLEFGILNDKGIAKGIRDFLQKLIIEKRKPHKASNNKITASNISIFCRVIGDMKINSQGNNTQEAHCMLVSKTYNLNYVDKVRQGYSRNTNPTKKQLEALKNTIIPTLQADLQLKLHEYIESKQSQKNNLYV
jgi:hypothetical protein